MRDNTFNRWDMLTQIILVKLTLYVEKNAKSKNFTVSFPGKTPFKLKIMSKKKSNTFHPEPAASTTGPYHTVIGPLLRF